MKSESLVNRCWEQSRVVSESKIPGCVFQDVEALLQYFSVLKRISLYLARACPNQTIDQLVSESSQMIQALDHVGVDVGDNQMPFAVRFSEASSRSESQTPELGACEGSKDTNRAGSRHTRSRRESREVNSTVHLSSLSIHSDGSIEGSQMSAKSDNLKRFDSNHIPKSMPYHCFLWLSCCMPAHELGCTQYISYSFVQVFIRGISCKRRRLCCRSPSNMSALGSERRGSEAMIAPSLKGLLQRSELSICLLSELAFEQGEKFTDHVPLLLHICVVCMDSPEPVVRLHCQELIVNLLRALSRKRKATGHTESIQEKVMTD